MVFFGLNIFESVVTRGSGTSTTAVWTSKRPAEAVVGVLPRVSALKIVVLPDWGNPIIPSFMFSFCRGAGWHPARFKADYQSAPRNLFDFVVKRDTISLYKILLDLRLRSGILADAPLKRDLRQPGRSGGIGRRARLKIVFPPGMRVRFPPSALAWLGLYQRPPVDGGRFGFY